jgi:hypothetical protein
MDIISGIWGVRSFYRGGALKIVPEVRINSMKNTGIFLGGKMTDV